MGTDGEHGRSFKTVSPLAEDLGLDVDLHCGRKDPECVADAVRSYDGPGNILVAWRHKNIGEIQEMLGSEEPIEYPDERYVTIVAVLPGKMQKLMAALQIRSHLDDPVSI